MFRLQSLLSEFLSQYLSSVLIFIHHQSSHLTEGEVSVGEEVSHLSIGVIDIVEQVPLDVVVLVVSVAVDGGAVVAGHVPQLVSLKPYKYSLLQ